MSHDIKLEVDGVVIEGWTSVQVSRSLDSLADTFALALSQSIIPPAAVSITGSKCHVKLDDTLLISGYIDEVSLTDDGNSSSFMVSGRSLAGDLLDCSAVHKPWHKANGLQIARDLCDPFGISVQVDSSVGELAVERYFKHEDGETVGDVLLRLGERNAARLVSRPSGNLLFTRTGSTVHSDVVVERGVNVVSASVRQSIAERYSDYVFKSQLAASDESYGEDANVKYTAHDDGVGRFRPLVVKAKTGHRAGPKSGKSAVEEAAIWERQVRAGRSLSLDYEIASTPDTRASWVHTHGVWTPNEIVSLRDRRYGLDGLFLVTRVTLVRDSNGTRTSLALALPEAYDVKLPPKAKVKKGFVW